STPRPLRARPRALRRWGACGRTCRSCPEPTPGPRPDADQPGGWSDVDVAHAAGGPPAGGELEARHVGPVLHLLVGALVAGGRDLPLAVDLLVAVLVERGAA